MSACFHDCLTRQIIVKRILYQLNLWAVQVRRRLGCLGLAKPGEGNANSKCGVSGQCIRQGLVPPGRCPAMIYSTVRVRDCAPVVVHPRTASAPRRGEGTASLGGATDRFHHCFRVNFFVWRPERETSVSSSWEDTRWTRRKILL